MYPKLIVMDLEGTLLKKATHLDDGVVAPSAWTLLAEKLGTDALREEQATKERWERGEYLCYVEWMRQTAEIHKKYGLNKSLFVSVLDSVEEMPGVQQAIQSFHAHNAITVIVTGGFKYLADRIQRNSKIYHVFAGCEYFFDPQSGSLEHWNLLPADYEGKVAFVKLIRDAYKVPRDRCAFVGDGKNDVLIAKEAGISIAFNAQQELKRACGFSIDQQLGKENFEAVSDLLEEV